IAPVEKKNKNKKKKKKKKKKKVVERVVGWGEVRAESRGLRVVSWQGEREDDGKGEGESEDEGEGSGGGGGGGGEDWSKKERRGGES
ncbi:hypothetical protein M0802_016416, partial [Mischocyttarus mexicanus]